MYVEQPDRGGTVRFKRFWRTKRTLKWRENESSHQRQRKSRKWPVLSSGSGIRAPPCYSGTFGVQATMEDKRNRERREVHYRGRVQGVGFRWTCRAIAAGFAVAGYVKNLADGQVLVVVEGEPDELDRFLAAVDDEMSRNIRQKSVQTSEAVGEFREFGIRF